MLKVVTISTQKVVKNSSIAWWTPDRAFVDVSAYFVCFTKMSNHLNFDVLDERRGFTMP